MSSSISLPTVAAVLIRIVHHDHRLQESCSDENLSDINYKTDRKIMLACELVRARVCVCAANRPTNPYRQRQSFSLFLYRIQCPFCYCYWQIASLRLCVVLLLAGGEKR